MAYRIDLLGGLQVAFPNAAIERVPIARFRTRKTALLLAYLALHPNRHHSREELIELFWPDLDLAAARDNLSSHLSALRRHLGTPATADGNAASPPLFEASRDAVWLNASVVTTDVAEFERTLDTSADRSMSPTQRRAILETAVSLYRGPFLPDVYEEWALSQQTRLAQRYALALTALADAQETTGARDLALSTARRAQQADPLHEVAYLIQMRILARSGQQEFARRVYQNFATYLERELGCQPSAALQAFTRRLDEIAQAEAPALPEGEDAQSPNVESQPPAASTIPGISHIPVNLARFWGRTTEVESLVALIRDPVGPRLITITGPGGMGKTHLSLVVAAQLVAAEPKRQVRWVPLADISDDRLFVPAVQQALSGTTSNDNDPIQTLTATLSALATEDGATGVVLLLDNLEQLVGDDATLGRVPARIRLLLERIPGLKIVGTSRRILGLANEQEFPLGPLPLPASENRAVLQAATRALAEMQEIPSVALFVERARLVRPDFALTLANAEAVAAICRRLEGLPLALEMAATWVRTLPLPQMRERLDAQVSALQSRRRDLPPRQRSLRATVEWSWELLDADLRPFFLYLSVFRGGFTYDAASQVAGADDPRTLDWLARLQEHSLLTRRTEANAAPDSEERYAFLEPVREWALEKLQEDTDAYRDARLRHTRYFQKLAETSEEQMEPNVRVKPDEQNCIVVLNELLRPQPDLEIEPIAVLEGLRHATSMGLFWYYRGQESIAYQFLFTALARYEAVVQGSEFEEPHLHAKSLQYQGCIALNLGRLLEAETCIEAAQEFFAAQGNLLWVARCESQRGSMANEKGDYPSAVRHFARAVELGREIDDSPIIAIGLLNLAATESDLEEWESASIHFSEALEIAQASESWPTCVFVRLNQATLALYSGDRERAQEFVAHGFALEPKIDNPRLISHLLATAAAIAAHTGKPARAVRLLASADRIIEESGAPLLASEIQSRSRAFNSDIWQSSLSAAEIVEAQERGRKDSIGEAIAYAQQAGSNFGAPSKF